MFNFILPFKIFVDGKELENVTALQLSMNKEKPEDNKSTIVYAVNGMQRILSVPLCEVSFTQEEPGTVIEVN